MPSAAADSTLFYGVDQISGGLEGLLSSSAFDLSRQPSSTKFSNDAPIKFAVDALTVYTVLTTLGMGALLTSPDREAQRLESVLPPA